MFGRRDDRQRGTIQAREADRQIPRWNYEIGGLVHGHYRKRESTVTSSTLIPIITRWGFTNFRYEFFVVSSIKSFPAPLSLVTKAYTLLVLLNQMNVYF